MARLEDNTLELLKRDVERGIQVKKVAPSKIGVNNSRKGEERRTFEVTKRKVRGVLLV